MIRSSSARWSGLGLLSATLGAMLPAAPTHAQTLAGPRMTDPELAAARGGFALPGGGVVTLGVTTDTRIDGREVLRTVFTIGGDLSRLTVAAASGGADALQPVTLSPDGAGVQTAGGVIRLQGSGDGARVQFAGDRVDITHLVGRDALGSLVVNAADNRAIDVSTSIDIGLAGIRPDQLGGAMARVDTVALDATTRLIR